MLFLVDVAFDFLITELSACAGHLARVAWGAPARGEKSLRWL